MVLRIFGVTLTVDNRNPHYDLRPYLFIHLNQASLIDAAVMAASIPISTKLLSNIEFAMIPFVGWAASLGDNIVVRRNSATSSRRAFQKCNSLLKNKENLILSIEGQRSKDGELSEYKKGAVVMAKRNKAYIVPISIIGNTKILPYGGFIVHKGNLKIIYHQYIKPESLRKKSVEKINDELRAIYLQE